MPELQKRGSGRVEQSGAYRFAKAWELAMSRREGMETGEQKGLQKGRQEGRKYGRIQTLESLLGLPETSVEALSTLSPEELDRRIEELTRRVRGRIS